MFYIIYIFVLLISLIPTWILYRLSDLMYYILFYVWKYRKDVVRNQIKMCFPDMTEQELQKNLKAYYHNMCDQIVETIKLPSMSEREFNRRFETNIEDWMDYLYQKGSGALWAAHFFNFEWMNHAIQLQMKHRAKANGGKIDYLYVGVYSSLGSKLSDRLFVKLRSMHGSLMLSTKQFMQMLRDNEKVNLMGLLLDQNPSNTSMAYWIDFFNIPTAFHSNPENFARTYSQGVLYAHIRKIKQGKYICDVRLLAEDPDQYEKGQLTKSYVQAVENNIREQIPLWMWSHKRWKVQYNEDFADNRIY